ncbi:MAG: N-acetylneuraminate synthase [Bacteroidales bacterium]|nr:N-acetylneuraminate synthase [Bacteroidales bacterium]
MNRVIIIAEAGVNHNGDITIAKQLIDEAKQAGADYVKFQTASSPSAVTSKFANMAEYQKRNVGREESQLEFLKDFTLPLDAFKLLKSYCDEIGINFLSTPFDLNAVDFLYDLGMDFMKVPSGEVTNLPYLKKVASKKLPVVMSSGMCKMDEVESALNVFYKEGLRPDDITLLHCNTEYPTPFEDVNLKAMLTMRNAFGVNIGYSDHTRGIEVPIAAVALGATVIEKHFTLDRNMPGPDHKASLEPNELKAMVNAIRNIEKAMGNGEKKVSDSERKNIAIARRSIVAAKDIHKGELLTEENLTVKRPGTGISPMRWEEVLGTKSVRDFTEDELIEL